jgi:hypothetical protein
VEVQIVPYNRTENFDDELRALPAQKLSERKKNSVELFAQVRVCARLCRCTKNFNPSNLLKGRQSDNIKAENSDMRVNKIWKSNIPQEWMLLKTLRAKKALMWSDFLDVIERCMSPAE